MVPTSRQLRKYGRLFESMTRGRQFEAISGPEAQELFNRSGLGNQVLAHIWALSDHDQDGYLIWPEFVLAMHLVRRQLAGQPPPPPGPEALPPELVQLLGALEPATAYASQPSRSPRSLSATRPSRAFDASPTRSASPAGRASGPRGERHAVGPPPEDCGAGAFGRDTFGGSEDAFGKGDVFGDGAMGTFNDSFGGDGGALDGDSFGGEGGHKKHKKHEHHKKKHRHHDEHRRGARRGASSSDEDATAPAAAVEGSGQQLGSTAARGRAADSLELSLPSFGLEGGHEPGELGSPSFGVRRSKPRRRSPRGEPELPQAPGSSASAAEQVEVLAQADRVIMRQLRRDTDDLDAELARLDDLCRQEALAMAREQDETVRLGKERELLEGQLAATQRALGLLRGEHRDLRMESVLLRRDHDHYDREAAFLQRLFDEGTKEAQLLLGSVEALELSNQSLLAHTTALEEAHHKVLQDLRSEEELLAREKQESQAAREHVESLRSGVVPASGATLAAAGGAPPKPFPEAFGPGAGGREPGRHRAAAHNEGV